MNNLVDKIYTKEEEKVKKRRLKQGRRFFISQESAPHFPVI